MHPIDNRTFAFKLFLWIYAVLYVVAGLNHFVSADVYYDIIPKWLPAPSFLIYLSGISEIVLGILLLFSMARKLASILLILMLIAFIPAHIYMVQLAPFMLGKVLITPFIAWARLPLQVLFIGWAWYYYRNSSK
ncbi:DoxX family membrane protein [Pedobacter sp. Leaf176]|uniref:DoxX family protein n=1 Tax=Pedobacter sp. Leaf176 TaxID=1736286 RepID=UPI0006F619F0|nr:DoxX family membrane protein [Pedobacter sp. Leaf176]KQR72586.1 DoxX family protein [Pedobacter sp. Leaf176]